jgi:hypothetical protein
VVDSSVHTSTSSTIVGMNVNTTARNTIVTERVPRSMMRESVPCRSGQQYQHIAHTGVTWPGQQRPHMH